MTDAIAIHTLATDAIVTALLVTDAFATRAIEGGALAKNAGANDTMKTNDIATNAIATRSRGFEAFRAVTFRNVNYEQITFIESPGIKQLRNITDRHRYLRRGNVLKKARNPFTQNGVRINQVDFALRKNHMKNYSLLNKPVGAVF